MKTKNFIYNIALLFLLLFSLNCSMSFLPASNIRNRILQNDNTPENIVPQPNNKYIIAVLDFSANGVSQEDAKKITELVTIELVKSEKFTVIERNKISSILNEQTISQTGLTDEKKAVEIGKLLSAEKILLGSVIKLSNDYYITTTIVDVEKGTIDYAEKSSARSIDGLDGAAKINVLNLTNKLYGGTASVVQESQADSEAPAIQVYDYSHADLKNAILSNKNFTKSNFTFANMLNADLSNSVFVKANLSHANLIKCKMVNSDFTEADFSHSLLTGSDLSNSKFEKADFSYAKVSSQWKNHLLIQNVNGYKHISWQNK